MDYREMKLKALAVPIHELLEREGIEVRKNKCRSPFRDEKNASFRIYPDKNRWKDYGLTDTHNGGDGINLIMKLKGVDFKGAVDYILHDDITVFQPSHREYTRPVSKQASGDTEVKHRVDSIGMITHPALANYLRKRRIPLTIANRYCKEVHYTSMSTGSHFFGIGFPNDNGGWAIRTAPYKGNEKGDKLDIIASGISTVKSGNDVTMEAYVFEGFMNFLSWCVINGQPLFDVIVLNSCNNVTALDKISLTGVNLLRCFPDNDAKGKEAYRHIEFYSGCDVTDESFIYSGKGYSDMNDYLINVNR